VISTAAPGSRNCELEQRLSMSAGALFARRLETPTVGVLGRLEATVDWQGQWASGAAGSNRDGARPAGGGIRWVCRRVAPCGVSAEDLNTTHELDNGKGRP